jgi:hypothetical protein
MGIVIIAWAATSGGRAEVSAGAWALLPWWTLGISPALVLVDLHRRREVVLLGNLGVITGHAVLVGTIPAFLLTPALTLVI